MDLLAWSHARDTQLSNGPIGALHARDTLRFSIASINHRPMSHEISTSRILAQLYKLTHISKLTTPFTHTRFTRIYM